MEAPSGQGLGSRRLTQVISTLVLQSDTPKSLLLTSQTPLKLLDVKQIPPRHATRPHDLQVNQALRQTTVLVPQLLMVQELQHPPRILELNGLSSGLSHGLIVKGFPKPGSKCSGA